MEYPVHVVDTADGVTAGWIVTDSVKRVLQRGWELGAELGRGGFGRVFVARSRDGEEAVVKLVPKAAGADRELLFANPDGRRNVVPIIDKGETPEALVLVMPRADKSLREFLTQEGGQLSVGNAIAVLRDIALGLSDLEAAAIVHRDLKPENVLYLHDRWCLADFGISRYAEATTAPDTQKFAMSPPYAAPERWRHERATAATDVYSMGVIAYELLSGKRPFRGPGWDDYREQHLHAAAPNLTGVSAPLAALVEECLFKPAGARPTPSNLVVRLERAAVTAPSAGLAKLQEAQHAEAIRVGQAAQLASVERSAEEKRAELFSAATTLLLGISDQLKDAVTSAAPLGRLEDDGHGAWRLHLGQAQLEFRSPQQTVANPWGSGTVPGFEVVGHAALGVSFPRGTGNYEGRAHSLWFCDALAVDRFQWFELAFMYSPWLGRQEVTNPFAMAPQAESAQALAGGVNEFQLAWPFTPLSVGDLGDFVERWAGWMGDAAQGKLRHPVSLPERQIVRNWRRV